MDYKMVAIDMDGTLLDSEKNVSKRNKEVLLAAQEAGKKIVISTGRILTSARFYSKYIGLESPIIACNGAIIKGVNEKEIFKTHPMDKRIVKEVGRICDELGISYHFYTKDKIYSKEMLGIYEFYHPEKIQIDKSYNIPIYDIEDFGDSLSNKEEILKFNILDKDFNKIIQVLEKIKNLNNQNSFTISLAPHIIELTNNKGTKGNALKDLGEYFNINREEIIAIGDSSNDRTMIEYAGLGIAMDNGLEDIKEIADYITLSNDQDGVVEVFEKFIL